MYSKIELDMKQLERITGGTDQEQIKEAWRHIGECMPELGSLVRTDPMSWQLYESLRGLYNAESSAIGSVATGLKAVIMESNLCDDFKHNACQLCDTIIREAKNIV